MNAIPSRVVAPGPGDTEKASPVFGLARERLFTQPAAPPALLGDLVLALLRPRPSLRDCEMLPNYSDLIRQLTRAQRWGFVVARLGQLARRSHSGTLWESVAAHVIESIVISLWRFGGEALASAPSEDALLERCAAAYELTAASSPYQDFSAPLLDDLDMALIELMRRARSLDFKQILQPKELIRECLAAPLDTNVYRPRLLCEVMRHGDKKPTQPGDNLDLRAITVKVREEQIPRILLSELAANRWRGRLGRTFTLDKVINRNPVIWEHHQTQRPELEHRILIVVFMGVTRHPAAASADAAEISAKALGFSLLANAALKVPHEFIRADVAWFQRDVPDSPEFQWAAQFPLANCHATASEGERWRNVVEMDRHLPRLFAAFGGGVNLLTQSDYILIKGHPIDYLTRACHGRYEGVFVVGIAPHGEAASLVPAPSLPLPPLPPGVPPVMLVTADPDARRGLRGATFPSLLAARMARAVLPPPPPEADSTLFFVEEFLKMIIGPVARRANAVRPRFSEVIS